jgi:murein L,D-transpeptidase YafK
MKYLAPIVVCLLVVLVGRACQQTTAGNELQSARGAAKTESDGQVQKTEDLKLPLTEPRIVVFKSKRQLDLYSDGAIVRTYRIGLGLNPVDDKLREGDRATPEGEFYIFTKNPKSAYYLSLGLSYPNLEDAERGLRTGLITRAQHDQIVSAIKRKAGPPQYTALGGLIYIHGNGATSDWTWGCVALENEDIKELFNSVDIGTPVTIKP